MKIFAFILLSPCFIVAIIYAFIHIESFILELRLKRQNKKYALMGYQLVKNAYEHLILSRRLYHKSKSYEDKQKMKEVQALCIKAHTKALETLSDPTNAECKQYLTEKQRKDLEEILALPRYELF